MMSAETYRLASLEQVGTQVSSRTCVLYCHGLMVSPSFGSQEAVLHGTMYRLPQISSSNVRLQRLQVS